MKKFLLFLCLISVICSCRKTEPNKPDTFNAMEEIASLASDEHFASFTAQYLETFLEFSKYQKAILGKREKEFVKEMKEATNEPGVAEQIYTKYSVDYDQVLAYQNTLDNALLSLYTYKPELTDLTEAQTNEVLLGAMTIGIHSKQQMWVKMQSRFNEGLNNTVSVTGKSFKINNAAGPELTGDEVWECIKDAVGINLGSQLVIQGIQKAGIKIITTAITKAVVKFAGPIGTAIMVAEFGFCMYEAVNN